MLSPSLRLAQAVHFDLLPEDESVLATIPTGNLIEELMELQSRANKALGE